jgi:hypothetical protein
MSDPQIVCPNCSHEIKLTESLAAPLLEETRQRFAEQLAAKDAEVTRKTEALRKEQDAVAQARIGFLSAWSDQYISARWTNAIVFSILILVLVFRPHGLLGERTVDKA